ncbi:ExbD/TolR family protein [Seohaeicola zhoushanensis]|uniref:Biopolymer transporter ExbD n=1 Tax=Seohaeicola zhoushanensis TaxID=1569283 RepID=A0A8J3GW40_9RHOB|nr:biopolymer transporter ExbD [Seohaeicola zhoushanensis]GHF45874.1 hypothetical protein GCM10017056_16890 [Seohaeicola zhoushanensis]
MSLRARYRRRALSMTSLIDVIFLLLLFFMLSSTFSKFSEVDLVASSAPGSAAEGKVLFLQVAEEGLRLNAQPLTLEDLPARLEPETQAQLVLSLAPEVTSQRLADVLVILRARPGLRFSILAPS